MKNTFSAVGGFCIATIGWLQNLPALLWIGGVLFGYAVRAIDANQAPDMPKPPLPKSGRGVCWVDLPAESQGSDQAEKWETITLARYCTNKPESAKK